INLSRRRGVVVRRRAGIERTDDQPGHRDQGREQRQSHHELEGSESGDVAGQVQRELHDQSGEEQRGPGDAQPEEGPPLATVRTPGGSLPHEEADRETDDGPADERRDEDRRAVDRVRDEAGDEIVLAAARPQGQTGGGHGRDQPAEGGRRRRLLHQPDDGEHGGQTDGHSEGQQQGLRPKGEQDHEREAREHRLEDPAPAAHGRPDDLVRARALGRVEPGLARGAAECCSEDLRRALRARLLGVRRGHAEPGRDEVARRHGRSPADDDDRAEEVLDLRRRLRVGRGRAADHTAQEPAGPVDADEAREAQARAFTGGRGHLREQLLAERPLPLLDATALRLDLVAQLDARLVPQTAAARSRERLHLERRLGVVEPDRHDALALLLHLEPQVQSLARQDLDPAEVDVRADGVRLGVVERALGGAVLRRRLGRSLVAVAGIDGAGRVHDRDAVLRRETAAGHHEGRIAVRQRDAYAGGDESALPRLQPHGLGGDEIGSG
ncbi:unnamed protein product, partial [Penicillium discolor]